MTRNMFTTNSGLIANTTMYMYMYELRYTTASADHSVCKCIVSRSPLVDTIFEVSYLILVEEYPYARGELFLCFLLLFHHVGEVEAQRAYVDASLGKVILCHVVVVRVVQQGLYVIQCTMHE